MLKQELEKRLENNLKRKRIYDDEYSVKEKGSKIEIEWELRIHQSGTGEIKLNISNIMEYMRDLEFFISNLEAFQKQERTNKILISFNKQEPSVHEKYPKEKKNRLRDNKSINKNSIEDGWNLSEIEIGELYICNEDIDNDIMLLAVGKSLSFITK